MKEISVVIPCLVINDDLAEQAKKAVTSIRTDNTEIILVDNGSTHGSDFLRQNADIYIRYPGKIGFGPACNAGLKLANGNYLVISSIDVEYVVGSVDELAKHYHSSFGALCPSAMDKGQGKDDKIHDNETFGATFIMSRESYEAVKLPEGLYDPRYEHGYYEDTDLWYRFDQIGKPLPRSGHVLVHHGQGTTNKALGVLDKYMEANHKRFVEKWGKEPEWRG